MAKDTEYWYKRTVEHILLTGLSQRTAGTYASEVRILGRFVNRPLHEICECGYPKDISSGETPSKQHVSQ